MKYKDFQQAILKSVKFLITEGNPQVEVQLREVTKNNGKVLQGIEVRTPDSNIAPVVYLEDAWKEYQSGQSIEDILYGLVGSLTQPTPNITKFEVTQFYPEKLYFQVIGAEQNQELLKNVPHQLKEDLAITYRVLFDQSNDGVSSYIINNDLLKIYGITQEKLHEVALENTPKLFPVKFDAMSNILGIPMDAPLYVLTNTYQINGATTMFYPGIEDQIRDQIGGDFYVLPSSIHEIIIVPANGGDARTLQYMVRNVNATVVDPEEVLSNSAYLVDKNGFTKVPDPEKEKPHFHEHSLEQLLDPIQDMDNDLEP